MFEHLSGQGRRVLHLAYQEAIDRGHDHLGTEHLLAGLLHEVSPGMARVFAEAGVDRPGLDRNLREALAALEQAEPPDPLPATGMVRRVLEAAAEEAARLRHEAVGVEHLFWALIQAEESRAADLLREHGLTQKHLTAPLEKLDSLLDRDRLVQAAPPPGGLLARDPRPEDLADRVTTVIHSQRLETFDLRPALPSSAILHRQLRGTQMILGSLLGFLGWVELYGWDACAVGILFGILIAGLRNSVLGALAFGAVGFFIGRQYEGWWFLLGWTGAGFFLGSWLGDFWQGKPESSAEEDEEDPSPES